MKKLLLLAAFAGLSTITARAQATDASGVPLINRPAQTPAPAGTTVPPPPPAGAGRAHHQPLPPDEQANRQTQRLTQALGLSADQQAKVHQIIFNEREGELATQQQMQASGAQKGFGKAKKASRAQADDQLRGVLTPDQYSRYQQLLAQRKQGKGHKGQQGRQTSSNSVLD